MTEYLLLFRNASAPNGYLPSTQDTADDMPKWQSWIGNIAMQGKLIHTAPIRYEGSIVDGKNVQKGQPYKESESVLVSGFLICKSDRIEEVEEWSKSCPILKYPNSSVEVRPLVPFPLG
ncbi:YciI family protein [Algoriphagus litoralis]|uniref:YciI family protein n=1 Tax=Algoriphagus litoralis TaxID=2202829 RepID=UPI000DB9E9A4|nr:YciI family protein [Algoriphagus litoralis]